MFLDGFTPCFPDFPISEIKLQGEWADYDTDDMIITVTDHSTGETRNLLCQIAQTVFFTEENAKLRETILDAWKDFNEPRVFQKGKDCLALFTGLLDGTVSKDVMRMLEIARTSKDAKEFQAKLDKKGFCSAGCRNMFNVILFHLAKVNSEQMPESEDWFLFLQSFHVFFTDYEMASGINQTVIQTMIGARFKRSSESIWDSTCQNVRIYDGTAGTITKQSQPFSRLFQPAGTINRPAELVNSNPPNSRNSFTEEESGIIVRLALLGEWSTSFQGDITSALDFLGIGEKDWESQSRILLARNKTPLAFHNKIWRCSERDRIVRQFGRHLTEIDLEKFEDLAVRCLSEPDPFIGLKYDNLPSLKKSDTERKHSPSFRTSLVESLAILAGSAVSLPKNIRRKTEALSCRVVRALLQNADWIRWASLSRDMPFLAESAPLVFLDEVENALRNDETPFKTWFAAMCNERTISGSCGEFCDAFEVLAWDETHLLRCCNALAAFADMAPQTSDWARGPMRAISKILLPWFPQTKASFEKQYAAVASINVEHPEVGWRTILDLFPNQTSQASETRKPKWNDTVEKNWKPEVLRKDYWNQIERYAALANKLTVGNENRLAELIKEIPHLPRQSRNRIISSILTRKIQSLPDSRRTVVWESVKRLLVSQEQFHSNFRHNNPAIWKRLQNAERLLRPKTPSYLYRRLFTEVPVNLFRMRGNWRRENEILDKRQRAALLRILRKEGLTKLSEIIGVARLPLQLGRIVSSGADSSVETILLPFLLGSKQPNVIGFVSGFISQRFSEQGWPWVESVNRKGWTDEQTGEFLTALPFEKGTWKRVSSWLKGASANKFYWNRLPDWLHEGKTEHNTSIKQLLSHGRSDLALDWLTMQLENIDTFKTETIERTLLDLPQKRDRVGPLDDYGIQHLISILEGRPDRQQAVLEQIEWRYLPKFQYDDDFVPQTLFKKLSADANFFCDAVATKRASGDPRCSSLGAAWSPKEQRERAEILLKKWNLVPGSTTDGSFDAKLFMAWIKHVRKVAKQLKVEKEVERSIGEVLIYAPADPSGLWMHKTVAMLLNQEHAVEMRQHYSLRRFNSEQSSRLFAKKDSDQKRSALCRSQADAIENSGFFRLATELRGLANSYEETARLHQELREED